MFDSVSGPLCSHQPDVSFLKEAKRCVEASAFANIGERGKEREGERARERARERDRSKRAVHFFTSQPSQHHWRLGRSALGCNGSAAMPLGEIARQHIARFCKSFGLCVLHASVFGAGQLFFGVCSLLLGPRAVLLQVRLRASLPSQLVFNLAVATPPSTLQWRRTEPSIGFRTVAQRVPLALPALGSNAASVPPGTARTRTLHLCVSKVVSRACCRHTHTRRDRWPCDQPATATGRSPQQVGDALGEVLEPQSGPGSSCSACGGGFRDGGDVGGQRSSSCPICEAAPGPVLYCKRASATQFGGFASLWWHCANWAASPLVQGQTILCSAVTGTRRHRRHRMNPSRD